MDRKQINSVLSEFFRVYQSARYQGIVITVQSETDFDILRSQIEAILLEYDIWSKPGANNALSIPCRRRDFMDAVFLTRAKSLVIMSPLDWMLDWSEQDQATFWNAVADAFGRHWIVILSVATHSVVNQLRVSLTEHHLPGLPVSVWLSSHQPVDHLGGILA
jgi:hypothetical protein